MREAANAKRDIPRQLLGRELGPVGLAAIKEEIRLAVPHNRAEIARRVCRRLDWRNPGGQYQFMSTRVALLRLHRDGLIELPPPTCSNGNGKTLPLDEQTRPPEVAVTVAVHELKGLHLQPVETRTQSGRYNNLMGHYHYLGHTPMAGAQMRYLIGSNQGLLGAIGFGASAWKLAARDRWIGWTPQIREQGLHLIVNNHRFLILPYVRCQNLASKVLSMINARIPRDFRERYGYAPVLLETFVEVPRFTGHCYRAANWHRVGQTTGRGKKHRRGEPVGSIKDIWLYPLRKGFRDVLGSRQDCG